MLIKLKRPQNKKKTKQSNNLKKNYVILTKETALIISNMFHMMNLYKRRFHLTVNIYLAFENVLIRIYVRTATFLAYILNTKIGHYHFPVFW